MSKQNFHNFAFYIPPEFEETWKRFIELAVPEEEKLYLQSMKDLDVEKKNNKNYIHKKNKFVSTAIRRLIYARVTIMEKKLLVNK